MGEFSELNDLVFRITQRQQRAPGGGRSRREFFHSLSAHPCRAAEAYTQASVVTLEFTFQHIRLGRTRSSLPRARRQIVGKGPLAHGLLGRTQADFIDQQAAGEGDQAEHAEDVADEARQQQQAAANRNQQTLEHFLLGQLAARQFLARAPGGGDTGNAQQDAAEDRRAYDQQQRRQHANGAADLDQQRQFDDREQQEQKQKNTHQGFLSGRTASSKSEIWDVALNSS